MEAHRGERSTSPVMHAEVFDTIPAIATSVADK